MESNPVEPVCQCNAQDSHPGFIRHLVLIQCVTGLPWLVARVDTPTVLAEGAAGAKEAGSWLAPRAGVRCIR